MSCSCNDVPSTAPNAGSVITAPKGSGPIERPPFHVYHYRREFLLIDVAHHHIFRIDAVAYDYLKAIESGSHHDEALALVLSLHGAERALRMLAEIDTLSQHGYLAQEAGASTDTVESCLTRLLGHHPRNVMLLVTEACNLKCSYCYEVSNSFHDAARMLSIANADRILADFFRRSEGRKGVTITFFGGEPLLNFRLIKYIVASAIRKGAASTQAVSFSITTNGTLITDEIADFLVTHRFSVMVSLDGEKDANDRYRVDKRGNGSHDAATQGIRLLLSRQVAAGVRPLKIRATMTRENSDPRRVEEYLRSFGPVRVMVGASTGTAFSKASWDVPHDGQEDIETKADELVSEFLARARSGSAPSDDSPFVKPLRELHSFIASKTPTEVAVPRLCGVGRNMLAITPQGDSYPCHRYVGMESWNLGNVYDGGTRPELLKSYYGKLFSGFLSHCVRCWMRFRCGGQCPWYLSTPSGSIVHPDSESCDAIRKAEERVTWLYVTLRTTLPAWFAEHVERHLAHQPGIECGLAGSSAPASQAENPGTRNAFLALQR